MAILYKVRMEGKKMDEIKKKTVKEEKIHFMKTLDMIYNKSYQEILLAMPKRKITQKAIRKEVTKILTSIDNASVGLAIMSLTYALATLLDNYDFVEKFEFVDIEEQQSKIEKYIG